VFGQSHPAKPIGIASIHGALEMLVRLVATEMRRIPQKGRVPVVADRLGAQGGIMFDNVAPSLAHSRGRRAAGDRHDGNEALVRAARSAHGGGNGVAGCESGVGFDPPAAMHRLGAKTDVDAR
jgi:hypothetical protein